MKALICLIPYECGGVFSGLYPPGFSNIPFQCWTMGCYLKFELLNLRINICIYHIAIIDLECTALC